MRFLFNTLPAYGHVYPLIPLARAARAAGHEVTIATTGVFVSKLEASGFRTYDVGGTIEWAQQELLGRLARDTMPRDSDGRPDPEMGGILFIDLLGRRAAADLSPLLAELVLADLAPDIVVYEQYALGGAVAAHAAGIPAVCHSLSPRMPDEVIRIVSGNRLDRLWADFGVSPAPFDVSIGDVYLDIFPNVLQMPTVLADPARMVMRPVPFAEPAAVLPSWIGGRSRPLVYLTLGTIVATDEVLLPAIEGLSRLDADILVALGSAAGIDLGAVPANVHIEAFVDQAAVLAHADLAVHHGGSGTILAALANRVPQILLPKGADQFFNADAMTAAGLAPVLVPSQATSDAVATLAKETIRARSAAVDAVGDEIEVMPHPASVIEALVERLRSSTPRRRPTTLVSQAT